MALPADSALWSGVIRALPAGLIALLLARTLPRGEWWWKAAILGILNIGAFFPLLFVSAYLLPGGVAAVFSATQPLFVAALALPLLGEKPTLWRLGWGVIAVAGVSLMVLGPEATLSPAGILAGLAGTASMGAGTVLSKKWGRPVGPVAYAGWLLTAGGLFGLPLAFAFEGAPPLLDAYALLGYAWLSLIGALLTYVLWFHGVGGLPAGAVSFLPLISPLVAAILGWALLSETLTLVQMLGFAMALLAVSAAQRPPGSAQPPLPREMTTTRKETTQ
ncbi:EamA family transporter [Citricoccus sp. NPDC079358]|uniref:EamA family transporter n=1 Tax=Citricoccus sp. NPDC079358 TaxID=3154653 RepID=UPI00344E02A6